MDSYRPMMLVFFVALVPFAMVETADTSPATLPYLFLKYASLITLSTIALLSWKLEARRTLLVSLLYLLSNIGFMISIKGSLIIAAFLLTTVISYSFSEDKVNSFWIFVYSLLAIPCLVLLSFLTLDTLALTIGLALVLSLARLDLSEARERAQHLNLLVSLIPFVCAVWLSLASWQMGFCFLIISALLFTGLTEVRWLQRFTDLSTGLLNLTSFEQRLNGANLNYSIAIFELSNLTSVLENYGFRTAEELLNYLGKSLKREFGQNVYRLGVNEFAFYFENYDDFEIRLGMEQFCHYLKGKDFKLRSSNRSSADERGKGKDFPSIPIRVHIGVASWDRTRKVNSTDLVMAAAQLALAKAKTLGQVAVVANPIEPQTIKHAKLQSEDIEPSFGLSLGEKVWYA